MQFPKIANEDLGRIDKEAFSHSTKLPITIVLDNIRSLHNIGSTFRTSDAFCIEKICLCGITACPPHREIYKTALGAEDTVAWEYYSDILSLIQGLKSEGNQICAVEQTKNSIPIDQFHPANASQPLVLIFGNEVDGVQQAAIDLCDHVLEIPQYGTKHSLNVSVSVGIVLWEITKKYHLAK